MNLQSTKAIGFDADNYDWSPGTFEEHTRQWMQEFFDDSFFDTDKNDLNWVCEQPEGTRFFSWSNNDGGPDATSWFAHRPNGECEQRFDQDTYPLGILDGPITINIYAMVLYNTEALVENATNEQYKEFVDLNRTELESLLAS